MARAQTHRWWRSVGGSIIGAVALFFLPGCNSVSSESAGVRSRIDSGSIAIGSPAASVLTMLGSPHLRFVKEGDPEGTENWVYIERRVEKDGTKTVGRFETQYDRESRIYSHFIVPEDRDQYVVRPHVVAVLTFSSGMLVSIELPAGSKSARLPADYGPKA